MPDGQVVSLLRYPVKSMMGEEVNRADLTATGVLGDRSRALIDAETGKVASAKNPKKWPGLFDFRAAYTAPPELGAPLPSAWVSFPDGQSVRTDSPVFATAMSQRLGRRVTLAETVPPEPSLEEYWPNLTELTHQDTVTDEAMPPGTFFDLAFVHLLTTATINQLRDLCPSSRFEARRFRPNIVISPQDDDIGFVEGKWVGQRLAIGDDVILTITDHCPRCVMTTLAQGDLPKDREVLRTAARYNDVHVGVYAEVTRPGAIRRGDQVLLC